MTVNEMNGYITEINIYISNLLSSTHKPEDISRMLLSCNSNVIKNHFFLGIPGAKPDESTLQIHNVNPLEFIEEYEKQLVVYGFETNILSAIKKRITEKAKTDPAGIPNMPKKKTTQTAPLATLTFSSFGPNSTTTGSFGPNSTIDDNAGPKNTTPGPKSVKHSSRTKK